MPTSTDSVKKYFKNTKLVCVDLGARNGTFELPALAPFTDAYGFEPNQQEYQKLKQGNTDLMEATGYKTSVPAYHTLEYFDVGLHNFEGEADLFITEGVGCTSLLEPDIASLSRYHHSLPGKPFVPQFRVKKKDRVKVSTLARIALKAGIDAIDYLKLDTQGNEYQILEGAKELLSRFQIRVIKCEVEFHPQYKGQALFSDIDILLRKAGCMLLDIVFADAHKGVSTVENYQSDEGVLTFADAFYCIDPERASSSGNLTPDAALKTGLVLVNLGYISLGIDFMRRYGNANEIFIQAVLQWYCPASRFKSRIRKAAKKYVPRSLRPFLAKIYNLIA